MTQKKRKILLRNEGGKLHSQGGEAGSKEQGKHFWSRRLDRFASYYGDKFGPGWQEEDKDFWEKFKVWY